VNVVSLAILKGLPRPGAQVQAIPLLPKSLFIVQKRRRLQLEKNTITPDNQEAKYIDVGKC